MSLECITKLQVHIPKSQTLFTYANGTTRLLTSDPGGSVLRQPCGSSNSNSGQDYFRQATAFLQRHFGEGGSIDMSTALSEFLTELGVVLRAAEELQEQPSELRLIAKRQPGQKSLNVSWQAFRLKPRQEFWQQLRRRSGHLSRWKMMRETWLRHREQFKPLPSQKLNANQHFVYHTWQLEWQPSGQAQVASYVASCQQRLQFINCAWHLKNCSRRHEMISDFRLPLCHCEHIKQTKDHINALINIIMPGEEQLLDELLPHVNGHLANLHGLVKQLCRLLAHQLPLQD